MAALEALTENEQALLAFEAKLEGEGTAALGEDAFEISKGMVSWIKGTKKISEIKYTPSVIEPSFGELTSGVLRPCPSGPRYPPVS